MFNLHSLHLLSVRYILHLVNHFINLSALGHIILPVFFLMISQTLPQATVLTTNQSVEYSLTLSTYLNFTFFIGLLMKAIKVLVGLFLMFVWARVAWSRILVVSIIWVSAHYSLTNLNLFKVRSWQSLGPCSYNPQNSVDRIPISAALTSLLNSTSFHLPLVHTFGIRVAQQHTQVLCTYTRPDCCASFQSSHL